MNSIVYKPLITRRDLTTDTTSGLNISNNSSSPRFKYTGYKPQYNWRDSSDTSTESKTTATPETAIVQEDSEVDQQIEWEDPSTINWRTTPATVTSIGTQQQSITTPIQHVFKTPDIDTGEMQEFLDVLADAGIAVRVTSGARPGAKTSSGNTSWHSQGRALDITPVSGTTREDFNKLKDQILNASTVIKYMQDHNIGILDETLDETLQKTGGSGWHFHIGPDQNALLGLQAWLNGTDHLAKKGMKFSILAKQGTKLPVILAKNGTNIPRKQQKLYDRVTERLIQQNQDKNISPITGLKYEEPIQPLTQEIMSFLPGIGDVIEAGNIVNDIKNKNYLPAILGTTLFLLPGNIPQIVRKLPEGTNNAIKIETFLPERLETGAIKRTHLPGTVDNKPIQEAMLDVPIEIGDSKGKAALYDFDNNKIILDKNLKESLYSEVIPHEWSHWLDYQSNDIFNQLGTSGFMMVPEKYLKSYKSDYFNPNVIGLKATTEVGPRLTQILDHLEIKNGNKILTWEEWKDAMDSYIKEHPDANMKLLKESIKDELLFTDWAKTNAK